MSAAAPHIIEFQTVGSPGEGFVSIAAFREKVPFEIQRVFWTYATPTEVTRGRHTHYETEHILIAAAGSIRVTTHDKSGAKNEFILDRPEIGLYLPALCWHEMYYSEGAVQLALASTPYDPKDYIRDKQKFLELIR